MLLSSLKVKFAVLQTRVRADKWKTREHECVSEESICRMPPLNYICILTQKYFGNLSHFKSNTAGLLKHRRSSHHLQVFQLGFSFQDYLDINCTSCYPVSATPLSLRAIKPHLMISMLSTLFRKI